MRCETQVEWRNSTKIGSEAANSTESSAISQRAIQAPLDKWEKQKAEVFFGEFCEQYGLIPIIALALDVQTLKVEVP